MSHKYQKLKNDSSDDAFQLTSSSTNKSLPLNSSTVIKVRSGTSNVAYSTTSNQQILKNRATANTENESNTSPLRRSSQRPDNQKQIQHSIKYLEYTIDHSKDTLNSIAIKFKVDLQDIKRHNNLQSDSGFHALKNLNIPLNKFSSLFDLPEGHENVEDHFVVRRTPSVSSNGDLGDHGRQDSLSSTGGV